MPEVTASYGTPLDLIAFFWVFSYIIDDHSRLTYCIFTKLSQIVYLINIHNLVCQLPKCNCRFSNLIAFFWEFSYTTTYLKRYNFTKLLQIVCWLRQKCRDEK